MDWVIGIVCSLAGVAVGLVPQWLYARWKRREAGLTGKAHDIVASLGTAVKQSNGRYYAAETPTDNFRITSHIYQQADGEVIGTSFRENPLAYGDKDLARCLPHDGAGFTRISSTKVCSDDDAIEAKNKLAGLLSKASLVVIPESEYLTCIDGIFCKMRDETYLAFATFPKVGDQEHNRGILFYGNIAKAFFDYYNDLKNHFDKKDS